MDGPNVIYEYQSFTCDKSVLDSRYKSLDKHTFDRLEAFVLANRGSSDTDPLELMSISSRSGIGKIISAKNYVGLITMTDGTRIEILPKIYSTGSMGEDETKKIFLEMLRTVKELPFKTFDFSNLKTDNVSLFDIFIRMFLDEVISITKRGLKSNYVANCENLRFYKGKIKLSDHIKNNYGHKERVYVEFDEFSVDRPENKLIKATISYIKGKTKNIKNSRDCAMLLSTFDEVSVSINYEDDFSKCTSGRNMAGYDTVLRWCHIFLQNKSFTAFSGSDIAYALLFPMETVFESYVAEILKKSLDSSRYTLRAQDKGLYLFSIPKKKFAIKPDIVITDKNNDTITVLDTKWKLLSPQYHNFGISQADMYQMYVYGKKYHAKEVILLYPLNEYVKDCQNNIAFTSDDGVIVKVRFVDLRNAKRSLSFGEILYEKLSVHA